MGVLGLAQSGLGLGVSLLDGGDRDGKSATPKTNGKAERFIQTALRE
jgi:hypothetical protein